MTAFDYAVLAVLAVSVVLGLWRGVVSELLALAAWVTAFFLARTQAATASGWLASSIPDPGWRLAAAYALVFIAVLAAFFVARVVISMMLKAVGLGMLDRLLGAVFGVLRGLFVVLAGVLVCGMTPMPQTEGWRNALLSPPLETAAIALKPWLPADVAKRIKYRG
jgi:membrane protein required for colicin V production